MIEKRGCILSRCINFLAEARKFVEGMLNATLALIAQGETRAAATAAGTPTSAVIERFAQFSGSVTRNGAALGQVVSADLSYTNNLDKVEVIRSDGRIADVDPAMVALDGNVTVRFADTVLLDQASSGFQRRAS